MWKTNLPNDHLEQINQRLRVLEEAVMEIKNTLRVQPIQPIKPVNISNICTKCGIPLDVNMGFICNIYPCPSGLGSGIRSPEYIFNRDLG